MGFQFALAVHERGQAAFVAGFGRLLPLGPEVVPVVEHVQHVGQQGRVQSFPGQLLLHKTQTAALGQKHPAPVGGLHPGQQAQQGGFARAVGAADAEPHAGIHLQRKIAEDVPAAE